jgi:hypothetical protein
MSKNEWKPLQDGPARKGTGYDLALTSSVVKKHEGTLTLSPGARRWDTVGDPPPTRQTDYPLGGVAEQLAVTTSARVRLALASLPCGAAQTAPRRKPVR